MRSYGLNTKNTLYGKSQLQYRHNPLPSAGSPKRQLSAAAPQRAPRHSVERVITEKDLEQRELIADVIRYIHLSSVLGGRYGYCQQHCQQTLSTEIFTDRGRFDLNKYQPIMTVILWIDRVDVRESASSFLNQRSMWLLISYDLKINVDFL